MKNKIIIYLSILVLGIIIGVVIISLLPNDSLVKEHVHTDQEQLYSCGMHPNIIESEPGTCPICGMNLTPIKNNQSKSSGERKILYWKAPMNPNEIYDEPGKSKMGMDLVPVYEDESSQQGVVTVDGSVVQSMNIKLSEVTKRELNTSIYTNGVITTDERKEFVLNSKMSGWIEKLHVNFEGQRVQKGQKLIEIYSPELIAAQQELITAINFNSNISSINNKDLVNNAIRKLELFDVPRSDIDQLIKTKTINKLLPIYSPLSGTVLNKNIVEGEKITPNKPLLKFSDLTHLWLKADIYESDLSTISLGDSADVTFNYLPGKIYNGTVSFIYPTVEPNSRTVSIRIDLINNEHELKPSMFGNVTIKSNAEKSVISIPESSVIRSGKKNTVVISLGDGKYKPVEVDLGIYSNGYYEVLNGLKENDKIVTSGQFMLDSESSLRAAINLFTSTDKSNNEIMVMENDSDYSRENNTLDDPIVRKGIINLEAIDENGDGKVFQDPMDWNVISDKDGRCPVCGMFLKEVTIQEAKENLDAHGYKYK